MYIPKHKYSNTFAKFKGERVDNTDDSMLKRIRDYEPHIVIDDNPVFDFSANWSSPVFFTDRRGRSIKFKSAEEYVTEAAKNFNATEDVAKIILSLDLLKRTTAEYYYFNNFKEIHLLKHDEFAAITHDIVLEQLLQDLSFGNHHLLETKDETPNNVKNHSVAYCSALLADLIDIYVSCHCPIIPILHSVINSNRRYSYPATLSFENVLTFVNKLQHAIDNNALKESVDILYDGIPLGDVLA